MDEEKFNSLQKLITSRPTFGILDIFKKRELFREIAKAFNGKFMIKHVKNRTYEMLELQIPYKNWLIIMSESDTKPLKFKVQFENLINFNLTISWVDFIEKVLKKLGKREIETGNKEYDDHYLIQTNDNQLAKSLLTESI